MCLPFLLALNRYCKKFNLFKKQYKYQSVECEKNILDTYMHNIGVIRRKHLYAGMLSVNVSKLYEYKDSIIETQLDFRKTCYSPNSSSISSSE